MRALCKNLHHPVLFLPLPVHLGEPKSVGVLSGIQSIQSGSWMANHQRGKTAAVASGPGRAGRKISVGVALPPHHEEK